MSKFIFPVYLTSEDISQDHILILCIEPAGFGKRKGHQTDVHFVDRSSGEPVRKSCKVKVPFDQAKSILKYELAYE